jgi:hypothetical protein
MEKFKEISSDHHSSTYVIRSVGVEDRITDDQRAAINVDGPSVLKVACPPPGHGRNIRKILATITPPLT